MIYNYVKYVVMFISLCLINYHFAEWFVNGKPLPSGARFKSTYDFGYVSLDINHAYAEDSGIYMCKATNNKGQAQTSGTLRCISKYFSVNGMSS
jgi:hypothetical protein